MTASVLNELLIQQNLIAWTLAHEHQVKCHVNHHDLTVSWLDDGILSIEPLSVGNTDIILSCGIHGNETAPIEMLEEIFTKLITGETKLRCRLLIILGNIPAMRINKRFCEENLNRLFSQQYLESDTLEAHRAARIEQAVDQFYNRDNTKRIHLDMHTAIRGSQVEKFAIYPYQENENWASEQLNWLAVADIQAVLLGHQPSGTFSYFTASKFGAMAFTLELGKALAFGQNNSRLLTKFKRAIIELIDDTYQWQELPTSSTLEIYRVVDEVLRLSEHGFKLNLSDNFLNFTMLNKGEVLCYDEPAPYQIKQDKQRIVFPNKNVPVGQRVALVIEPYDPTQIQ